MNQNPNTALILIAMLIGMPIAGLADDVRQIDASANDARAERQTGREVRARQARIEQEAIEALRETREALVALDRGDRKAALEALARATGKLELLVSRHPELGLIPVDVRMEQIDLVATEKAIREAVERAEDLLEDGEIQAARHLLDGLASELVIRTTHIPLATYPEAIKAISPLIDDGKVDEARDALAAALATLVVTEEIVPLPVLRATILLRDAETLAEKPERSDEEQKLLEALLTAAEAQIRYAELLGYGRRKDYAPIYEQIEDIRKQVADKQHGKGFFDRIREAIETLGRDSQKQQTGAE